MRERLSREWLVTNGLGGYASGTLAGTLTRRYHGVLIAALPAPLGRLVMVTELSERLRLGDGRPHALSGDASETLRDFRLDAGLPVWTHVVDDVVIEKRLVLPRFQNTVFVSYRVVEGPRGARLSLRPLLNARPHEAPVNHPLHEEPVLLARQQQLEIRFSSDVPSLQLRLFARSGAFTYEPETVKNLRYSIEERRGYEFVGDGWAPGYFRAHLQPGETVTLMASTEPAETITALTPAAAFAAEHDRRLRLLERASVTADDEPAARMVLAADQFIIAPAGRVEDRARARASGDEARTVIAGYHWFTDWGRDTMISLEGLTVATGRADEARNILRTFGLYLRDGLIPNLFPEGNSEGLYHTADATLWFFHALHRYLLATDDWSTLRVLLPKLRDSVDRHIAGTRFNIGVDPADGLLRQGAENLALTWMDAKMGDWVVTPRRGKAVEINALWYNALRLLADWLAHEGEGEHANALRQRAADVKLSFNRRFWYDAGQHLFDVIDGERGDDPACRPNQIFAVALDYPVLDQARWAPVVEVVERRLLTPVGLRSLDPAHADYRPVYSGDLRSRDGAYHQGTVWGWLIGPFVDAWLRTHPGRAADARRFLDGLTAHLDDAGVGSASEIFDAEEPFAPRGCIAQAWTVAELLRCWLKTGAA